MQSVSVSHSVGFQLKKSSQANSQDLRSSKKFPPYNQGSVAGFWWKCLGRSTLTMIGCPPVGAALGAGSFGVGWFGSVTLLSLRHHWALIIRRISSLDGPAVSLAFCAA